MSGLITAVTTWFTAAIGYVAEVADVIAENDMLLLCCVAVPLVGVGVGLFKRLITIRA